MSQSTNDESDTLRQTLAERHYRFGWWSLLLFLSLGALLETFHGIKWAPYLDPEHRVRREMWTLAHAHGTLLSLIQIAFGIGLKLFGTWTPVRLRLTSFLLMDSAILIPLGFLLGGVTHSEGDPSWGILLVPVGALALFTAVASIAGTR